MAAKKCAIALNLIIGWIAYASVALAAARARNCRSGSRRFQVSTAHWLAVEDRLGKKVRVRSKSHMQVEMRPRKRLSLAASSARHCFGKWRVDVACSRSEGPSHCRFDVQQGREESSPRQKSKGPRLEGKVIGTGRPGALNDIMVRYVLTRKWGISA